MPKIFGDHFHKIDFDRPILSLRLDDMPQGEFLEFGFKSWPKNYGIQPENTTISSVHVNFIGKRARVGFRFTVGHTESRFEVSQDEIDRLRSREFPRKSQDQKFLDAAREALKNSFQGKPETDMHILTVDLGEREAAFAYWEGKEFREGGLLKILKKGELIDHLPKEATDEEKVKGLTKEHVGKHLTAFSEGAQNIAAKRPERDRTLHRHDLRRLSTHIRWMIRDWVRHNASRIILEAEKNKVDLIVFESLREFLAPGYDLEDVDKKRWLAVFSYGKIRRKVTEKAVERGMRVVSVPYLYSSQTCSECGKRQEDSGRVKKNKNDRRFICEREECGYKSHSDKNAARVLGRVFWGDIVLPVELDDE